MIALIVPTILIIFEQILLGVNGYPSFQSLIPNGNKVPNPCAPDTYWPGVGHELIGGTGPRNAFGFDFLGNNKTWTKALCEKDSDGDGIKNGIELGDPDCTWSPNSVPKFSANLSHPGVCEPMNSHQCMGNKTWLTCPKKFSCPDFQQNSTKSLNMVLPNTTVPAKETTYMCYGFKMPNDTKYHAIGLTPHIVNKEIMHHMLVLGCKQPPPDGMLDEPKECVMGIQECQTIIGLWSVGIDGECHPDQYGFPIGVSGYQYAVVQLHWNNPGLRPGMMDSSGVTLYYTDQLRPNDAMVFMVGQQVLEIPPQQQSVTYSGTCREACTRYLPSNKTRIPSANLHMHLLGKSGTIELLRDGKVSRILVNQTAYDYNTPVTFTYDPPVEFRAGDELKVTCDYQSMNQSKTVYWGEGTQDEMCYGFVTIYPAVVGFDFCSEFDDIFVCSLPQFNVYAENDCLLSDFSSLWEPINKTCLLDNCSKVCKVLMKGLEATGCMRKSMWNFNKQFLPMFSPEFKKILPLIENCWEALLDDYNQSSTIKSDTWSTTPYFNESHSSSTSSVRTETTSGPGHTPGCSNVISSSISIQSGSAIYTSLIGLLLNAWFHLIHSYIQ